MLKKSFTFIDSDSKCCTEFCNKYSLPSVDDLILSINLQYFRSTQLSPFMSIGECNSEPLTFGVNSINHTEGGWPKVLLLLYRQGWTYHIFVLGGWL